MSQGTDDWGGSSTSLVQLPNNVLQGEEGSGVIQFIGTYSKFSWTVPTPEMWHGFTFGILTSAALYDGGGPDGSTVVIGEDGGVVTSGDGGFDDAGDAGPAPSPDASAATPEAGTEGGIEDAGSPPGTVADAGEPPAMAGDDASVEDASVEDAGVPGDAASSQSDSSCGCKAAGAGGSWGLASLAALLGAAGLLRRRRSRDR